MLHDLFNSKNTRSSLMDKKVLDIINQILMLSVYTFIFAKNFTSTSLNILDNYLTLISIIISILLMIYSWRLK